MMRSIFRLEEIRGYEPDGHLYCDAGVGILGHYSSLDKAMEAMAKNGREAWDAEEIMAYMVKEIAMDGDLREVSWWSVRTYDAKGVLIDECLQDYNLCNQFEGRNPEAIRFKVGDMVEVLEGRRLFPAIVAALPPTPEDHFPVLDAIDDCYLVLPLDAGGVDLLHVAPTHMFALNRSLGEEGIEYLRNRLLIYQGREDKANMGSICAIEGHQYLYNFASMPSKCICGRCHQKWKANYSGDIIHGEIWHEVDAFEGEERTDEELFKMWGGC